MNMPVTIRRAQQSDIDSLVTLWQEIADYHAELDPRFALASDARTKYREHLTRLLGDDNWRVFIAEEDGNAIGFITGTVRENPIFAQRWAGHISDAFVTARYRRRGVGEQLVRVIGDWFRERNVDYLELGAASFNPVAQSFWRKMGFEPYMIRMRKGFK